MSFEVFGSIFFPVLFIIIIVLIVNAASTKDSEYKTELTIIAGTLALGIIILTQVSTYIEKSDQYNIWMIVLWLYTPTVATIIGGITYLNYRRKAGVDIRLQFAHIEIGKGKDAYQYIDSLQLHNFKDKAERVFAIYLRNRQKEYLKLCEFPDSQPVFIKPFETASINLQQYKFYPSETNIDLFNIKSFEIILVTSNGQYVVKQPIYVWSPKKFYSSFTKN